MTFLQLMLCKPLRLKSCSDIGHLTGSYVTIQATLMNQIELNLTCVRDKHLAYVSQMKFSFKVMDMMAYSHDMRVRN